MAIKISKLKARMKVLFPSLTLKHKALNAIVVKLSKQISDESDDEAIDAVINNLNDLKSFQSYIDDAEKIAKLEKTAKSNKGGTEENPDDDSDDDDDSEGKGGKSTKSKNEEVPAWAKGMIAQNEKLSEQLKSFQEGTALKDKTAKARILFDKSEVLKNAPKKLRDLYFNSIDLDDEDSTVELQIAELEEDYQELDQSKADTTEHAGPTPSFKVDDKKATEDEINAIAGPAPQ